MDKNQQIDMIRKYYQTLCSTYEAKKSDEKNLPGHLLCRMPTFGKKYGFLAAADALAIGAIFGAVGALNTGIMGIIYGATVMPITILVAQYIRHEMLLNSGKGKVAQTFHQLNLNHELKKWNKQLAKKYQKVLYGLNKDEITQDDVNNFINDSYAFADKYYKTFLEASYGAYSLYCYDSRKKIAKMLKKMTCENEEKTLAKIDKIVEKTNNLADFSDVFFVKNAILAKNLYKSVVALDPQNNQNLDSIEKAKEFLDDKNLNFVTEPSAFPTDIEKQIREAEERIHGVAYVENKYNAKTNAERKQETISVHTYEDVKDDDMKL